MHLEAKALSKIYGQEENRGVALDRASLAIIPGGFISIMEPSELGKSTLLHLLPILTVRENTIMPLLLDKKQPGGVSPKTDSLLTQNRKKAVGSMEKKG